MNTIHDAYTVLNMAGNNTLHPRTFDMVLDSLSKYSSLEETPLRDIFDPLAPLYRGFESKQTDPPKKILLTELFELLTNYIDDPERLLIKEIEMRSPGVLAQ